MGYSVHVFYSTYINLALPPRGSYDTTVTENNPELRSWFLNAILQ